MRPRAAWGVTANLELVALSRTSRSPPATISARCSRARRRGGVALNDDDAIIVSQKVVSRAEGRVRRLDRVEPGERAVDSRAARQRSPAGRAGAGGVEGPDRPRGAPKALIVETSGGWICTNAGIDTSNVPGDETVVLLPEIPTPRRAGCGPRSPPACGRRPAVVVSPTASAARGASGRPMWRSAAPDCGLDDWRGRTDAHGRELAAAVVAIADELAAAADLARDKASGGPAVLVRGGEHLADRRGRAGRRGRAPARRRQGPVPLAGATSASSRALTARACAEGAGAPPR